MPNPPEVVLDAPPDWSDPRHPQRLSENVSDHSEASPPWPAYVPDWMRWAMMLPGGYGLPIRGQVEFPPVPLDYGLLGTAAGTAQLDPRGYEQEMAAQRRAARKVKQAND